MVESYYSFMRRKPTLTDCCAVKYEIISLCGRRHCRDAKWMASPGPERSSFFLFFVSAGQRFPPHRRTSGEFRMGGGVHDSYRTHSSADWWGLLLVGSFTSPGIDTSYRQTG